MHITYTKGRTRKHPIHQVENIRKTNDRIAEVSRIEAMIERAKQGGQASGSELETQTIYKDAHEHIEALQRYERYKRWGIFDPPVIRKTKPTTHTHPNPRQRASPELSGDALPVALGENDPHRNTTSQEEKFVSSRFGRGGGI